MEAVSLYPVLMCHIAKKGAEAPFVLLNSVHIT